MPPAKASDRPRHPFPLLSSAAVVLAAVLAYANTGTVPFVYDDLLAIPENPTIRRLWPLTGVLFPGTDGGVTTSGRPILNLSFALNHAISGTAVWSYHVTNLLIHASAGLLLLGLARRTFAAPGAGLGGRPGSAAAPGLLAGLLAVLWTAHPLHTQAVTYTVQRAESLLGACYLLTLYAFVRGAADEGGTSAPRRRAAWLGVSVAAAAAGTATKEVMVTAPLLVLLYDRTFVAGSFAGAWRARWRYYLALAATWILLAALLLTTGGNRGGTIGLGVGVPLWAYPLTQFEAIARYLGLAVWPHPLVFEYGTFWVRGTGDWLPGAAVVLPLLAATGWALRRRPAAGFLGAWFFGILAPTSLAPGTIQMIVEHRMYLPLAAVLAALLAGLHQLLGRRLLPLGCAAAAVLVLLTARRNHDYRSPLALWEDTVAKRPLNPRAHQGRAEALAAAGRLEEALRARREALRLLPDESHHHYNLAVNLAEAGRTEDAIRHYRLALQLFPDEARAHNNLAILLARLGRHAEALPHYAEAVRLRPRESLYRYNLAVAQLRQGRLDDAAASLTAAVELDPGHADSHFNLGAVRVRQKRPEAAIAAYEEALRLRPGDPAYATALGNAQLLAGRATAALATFTAVLGAHPDDAEARLGAGHAALELRRPAEAIGHLETLLSRSPGHAGARFKLANALLDAGRTAEAIRHYEAAIAQSPEDAEAHHNLGIAFARSERWDDARRAFDEALRLRPDYPDARRNREQLRQVTGR